MPNTRSASKILEGMRLDFLEAQLNWEIYRTLAHRRTRTKYWGDVILPYVNYFSCSLRAHFTAMVVALGRFFDENTKNDGIAALFAADAHIQGLEPRKLARAIEIWKKMLPLRHAVYAHRAGRISSKRVFEKATITLDEFGQLIGTCAKLINTWSHYLGNQVTIIGGAKTDFDAMLDTLMVHRSRCSLG